MITRFGRSRTPVLVVVVVIVIVFVVFGITAGRPLGSLLFRSFKPGGDVDGDLAMTASAAATAAVHRNHLPASVLVRLKTIVIEFDDKVVVGAASQRMIDIVVVVVETEVRFPSHLDPRMMMRMMMKSVGRHRGLVSANG